MSKCGILFPGKEIEDEDGCINVNCLGKHTCIDKDGVRWSWEEDFGCTCGCWDEYEERKVNYERLEKRT